MVAKFELLVERTLYKYLVKQLNSAWDKGIKFHVLGCGLKTFYPCISFFCGDDPCQHRISGVQEGNTSFGCVYCLFPTMKGKVYNPTEHLPRDIQSIKHCCAIAEQVISDEMGHLLTVHTNPEQKAAIRLLKNQNIHPHENPFHYAPMGYDNHIYKANPPDLLHLFCAGLMKSLTQWVLTIILQVNDEGKSLLS